MEDRLAASRSIPVVGIRDTADMATRGSNAEASSAIFGNSYFAAVVDAVAALTESDVLVTTRRVSLRIGAADSVVRPVILRLVAAGLLTPLPREGGKRSPQLYEWAASNMASAVVDTARACLQNSPAAGHTNGKRSGRGGS